MTADSMSAFATRGVPLGDHEHLDKLILPALAKLSDPLPKVKQLLESCTWDPREAGTVAAFSELVAAFDAGLAWVESLRDIMPPMAWRAVHRELARAGMALLRGQVAMASTIVAVDLDAARKLQGEGENWFGAAAEYGRRVAKQIEIIRNSPADGPIQADGSIDVAAVAWAGVGGRVTLIAAAADTLRTAFVDITGVSEAADEHILGLLPVLATSSGAVDHELLVARALQLRAVLDQADTVGPWVVDHVLLVARVNSALERITDEAERLGREWRYRLPRRHLMRTLTEVYRELVEGALCDLGAVILVASRASRQDRDGVYEEAVVEGIKSGDIVSELARLGPPCGNTVDMLYRNASAHASITVNDHGITATRREIRDGRLVSSKTATLSDEEFSEELLALHELLLALQLALLPWMTGHSDPGMATAVATATASARQRDQILALIAGLAGMSNVAVTTTEGHLTITAAPPAPGADDRPETKVLSVVPAAFGTTPTPATVTLDVTGLRPVTFTPEEFAVLRDPDEAPDTETALGVVTARWLLESSETLSPRDEATYITVPLADLYMRCAKLAPADQELALRTLRTARARVVEVIAEGRRSPLTRSVISQVDIMIDFLGGLAPGGDAPKNSEEAHRRARRAVAAIEEAHRIGEQARAVRDAER
ncbi:hypothetical protein [Kitasatospora sp. NPDC098663]|uniref:hypothetical protein n=1 Tax=Kitasatospora sp. NPDC098663 TaxID=3364096 RepID=UPI00382A46A8